MRILTTVAEMTALERGPRRGAVLTMGALHAGHGELMRRSRELIGPDGLLIVTVFVNPTQFGDPKDLENYPRTLEAAGDLYANAFTTFRKVTFPLSMPGVVAGTLLTFIPAAGDYVNAAILGNPQTKMLGNVIDSKFFKVVDYPTAAALSFMLMFAILVLVSVYIRRSGTDELV